MSQDVPLRDVPAIVVRTTDGTVFICTAYWLTGLEPAQLRWRLTDSDGRHVMGPSYMRDESPSEVEWRVGEWWEACKALMSVARGSAHEWVRVRD